jgi:hypothetical protein
VNPLAAAVAIGQAGGVSVPFPEPTEPAASRAEFLLRYLDFFRDRLVSKLDGIPPGELRASRLPSGWAPIELIKHQYARHVGQLDIVAELAGGPVGE